MYKESLGTIAFGREVTGVLATSEDKEWLVTNGLGGYASGTISGLLTRRYHGILVAPLEPPLGRTLLVSKIEEEIEYGNKVYALSANRWASHTISPQGYIYIESFSILDGIPTWRYAFGDALVEKKIWMEPRANTTYVLYNVLRATLPLKITLKAMANYRCFHNLTRAGNWRMQISDVANGFLIQAYDKAVPYYILSDKGKPFVNNAWYYGYYLSEEDYRGLDDIEDHLFAGFFEASITQGECLTVIASTDKSADCNGTLALKRRSNHTKTLLDSALLNEDAPAWIKQLILAADQFIVDRASTEFPEGKSIIAGYHWFGDWGRDTMISLEGLTLTTGRSEIAKIILQTYAKYVDHGMLPNCFPDSSHKPEYNTVDATLWYFDAIKAFYNATQDEGLISELFPVLVDIFNWHQKGTRYKIQVDSTDGLLYAGEQGIQLTWMDAKIGEWVVTPRIGKAIEINALWYNALKILSDFAKLLGKPHGDFESAAEKTFDSFQKFWNKEKNYSYDVIDGPVGNDPSLRPNQIFAVSLTHSPFQLEQQRSIVEICAQKLLTSHGLRSLDPADSRYSGHYGGNSFQRDSTYHQGTVWGWLLGPFSIAHYKVFNNADQALGFLHPMSYHLSSAGLGTCSEIFDGNAPIMPRGCIAQAWTVAQLLKAWRTINAQKNINQKK